MRTERLISSLKKSTTSQLRPNVGDRVFVRSKTGDVTQATALRNEHDSVFTSAGVIPADRVHMTKAEADMGVHYMPVSELQVGQIVASSQPGLGLGIVVDAKRRIVDHFTTLSVEQPLFQVDTSECSASITDGNACIRTPFDTIKTQVRYPQKSSPTQEAFLIAVALKFGDSRQGLAYLQKVALWE